MHEAAADTTHGEPNYEETDEDGDEDEEKEVEKKIKVNGTNDMICAECFNHGKVVGAVSICKECKYYLCTRCASQHRKDKDTKHPISFFYCASKLRVNKLVRANYFCLDCGQYLCTKCYMDHAGFRIYRNHTFIGGHSENDAMFDHVQEEPCDRQHRLRPTR